jgi:signal transduction histidine kinase
MSIRDCVNQTLQALSARALEKRLPMEQSIESQIPDSVIGDPSRLRQILINLVGNSIKFTHEGKISVHVRCLGSDQNGM